MAANAAAAVAADGDLCHVMSTASDDPVSSISSMWPPCRLCSVTKVADQLSCLCCVATCYCFADCCCCCC